jgi:hypothetical protein
VTLSHTYTQIRQDLMYMLDNLVGVACAPSAQGRRDMLAKNCLEGLLYLADAHEDWPKLSGYSFCNVVNNHFLQWVELTC